MNKHDLYNWSIIDLIEFSIQELVSKEWEDDDCKPEFWISVNNDDMNDQRILITINHLGNKFTQSLFPRQGTEYGYDSVLGQLKSMYASTM